MPQEKNPLMEGILGSLGQVGQVFRQCMKPYEQQVHTLETEVKAKQAYETAHPNWAAINDTLNPFYYNSRELIGQLDHANDDYLRALPNCAARSVTDSNTR